MILWLLPDPLHIVCHLVLLYPCEVGLIFFLFSRSEKLRSTEVKSITYGSALTKFQIWGRCPL